MVYRKRLQKHHWLRLAIALALLSFPLAWPGSQANASVTLAYFIPVPGMGQVRVTWGTATEIDTIGFYVLRSQQKTSGFERISEFIFAQGDPLTGANYEYLDFPVTNGVLYWYRLESLDTSQSPTFYDPVAVIPGVFVTNTPTRTSMPTGTSTLPTASQPTRTRTPTPSPTQPGTSGPTGTATATRTATPITPTPYPGIETSTPFFQPAATRTLAGVSGQATGTAIPGASLSQTPAISGTQVTNGDAISGTATLIPFPTLIMVFPAEETPQELAMLPAEKNAATPEATPSPFSAPQRLVPLALVVVIWGVLGGWLYYSLRKPE